MEAFHSSHDSAYRRPCTALQPGQNVTLALDVKGDAGVRATLRTWLDGAGERTYAMEDVGAAPDGFRRFGTTIAVDEPDTLWYSFILEDGAGTRVRYGAQQGYFGGIGRMWDAQPPSFQLTVAGETAREASASTLEETAIGFFRGMKNAFDLAQAAEARFEVLAGEAQSLGEQSASAPGHGQIAAKPWDSACTGGDPSCDAHFSRLLERLAPDEEGTHGGGGAEEVAQPSEHRRGLAKGRLWCACIALMLGPDGLAGNRQAEPEGESSPQTTSVQADTDPWAADIADCWTIVGNVADLRATLPAFERGSYECFAADEAVFGFWRRDVDGQSVCVLVNGSPREARRVCVPCAQRCVDEVVAGYGVPVEDVPGQGAMAIAHLNPLSVAVLWFHPQQMMQRALEPGCGILAHITSLPAQPGQAQGTLGAPAHAFVDWLAQSNARYWQVLPVNPTDEFGSPYAGISAFAGNVALIDRMQADPAQEHPADYRAFCERERDWLEPYAQFMAIRETLGDASAWQGWPEKLRSFDPDRLQADPALAMQAESFRRQQFAFQRQWDELRRHANRQGLAIIGDMPIYVSADSADVWAHPELFELDADGRPCRVAGCPPDAFAREGQVWGNPVYDWKALANSGYDWWLRRLKRAFELYDYVRLDHFIGFSRYFSIPAGKTALDGSYRRGPGLDFFQAAYERFGALPTIAEDLGLITPAVRALVAACGFAGMDVVQFADGDDPLSGYAPRPNKVVYTGTHDNQTLVGYCRKRYPEHDPQLAARTLMEQALRSSAAVCIVPLQDILGLGDEARMNTPGVAKGNWTWRADAESLLHAKLPQGF